MVKAAKTKPEDTIAEKISRTLAERIVRGELAPGARLRQDHVAEEFGASHVPVREAFRRLEAQGLAVSIPRRGVRVADFGLADVQEVAEMRAALEVLALRHPQFDRCHIGRGRSGHACGRQGHGCAPMGRGEPPLPPAHHCPLQHAEVDGNH